MLEKAHACYTTVEADKMSCSENLIGALLIVTERFLLTMVWTFAAISVTCR